MHAIRLVMEVQCFLGLSGSGAGDHGGFSEQCSCSPLRWTGVGASARVEWGVKREIALKKVS